MAQVSQAKGGGGGKKRNLNMREQRDAKANLW